MGNELILSPQEENRLAVLKTSPKRYFAELRPTKVEDVFASNEPTLAVIQHTFGIGQARAAVVMLISEVLEFFNATETMNDRQVAMTVDLIIEEYPYLKTDDLKLCFRNAMKMRYGKLYNRIDGQVIMGWLREYNRERCTTASMQSYNEHKAHLSEEGKSTEGIFYSDYRSELERKARESDGQAIRLLELSDGLIAELETRKVDKARENLERFYKCEEELKSKTSQHAAEKERNC